MANSGVKGGERVSAVASQEYVGLNVLLCCSSLTMVLLLLLLHSLPWRALLLCCRYRMFDLEQGGAPSCMRAVLAAAERQNFNARCAASDFRTLL